MRDPCVILSGLIRMIGEFELLGWHFVTMSSPCLSYFIGLTCTYLMFILFAV